MLIFSDLHLDNFRQFSTILKNGFNSRLMDQIKVIDEIKQIADETKTENIIFLGDLINSYTETLPKIIYNAAFCAIKALAERANVYLILGNHDLYRKMNVLLPLSSIPNVYIIANTMALPIEEYTVDLVPWDCALPKQKADILMGHLEVKGTIVNCSGHQAEEGYSPTDLVGYKYIFLGHFHEPQLLPVNGATHAEYVGSVMQIDRGSFPVPRGAILFNNNQIPRRIFINSPRIYSMVVDSQEQMDHMTSQIKKGDYWHLTIKEPSIVLPDFDESFDHRVQIEWDVEPTVDVRLEEKPGEDLKEEAKRFIQNTNTKINKERALELLEDVMI